MEECKVRTPMQDGGINARCEHRCKMAVRTPMQTAMDGNGNGWHEMNILCCVCCFLFVTSAFAAFGVRTRQCFCVVASAFATVGVRTMQLCSLAVLFTLLARSLAVFFHCLNVADHKIIYTVHTKSAGNCTTA